MYLNHDEIVKLCVEGHMQNVDIDCVNAASLDLRLGGSIMVERHHEGSRMVDYRKRQKLDMEEIKLLPGGFVVSPGEFFLAHTVEICNFPDNLAALFRIKSSMGRIGLEHMDAGWVDPGFHGSLTLEFVNTTKHHSILIRPGDKIGQLIFFRGNPVAAHQSYKERGNYNGHTGIAQVGYKRPPKLYSSGEL